MAANRKESSRTKEPSPYSRESVRTGVFHYLFGRGIAGLAGFATVLLLVRFMDLQNYAGYTALTGVTMMCGIVASLGLERAIARYAPEGQMQRGADELGRLIWTTALLRLATSLTIAFLVYAFWTQLTQALDAIDLERFPLPLVFFIVAETLFQHFSSVYQALMLQKTLTRLLVIQWLGRLLLIAATITIYKTITLEMSLWIFAVPEMLGVLAFVLVLRRHLWKPFATHGEETQSGEAAWPPWRGVMRMAMHNYGFSLLAAPPQGYFMRILIAAMLPLEMVAAYGFFQSLAEKARQYIPMHFFYSMIEPLMMAKYLKDGNFRLLSYRCQILYKTNLLLFIPAIVWIAAAGPYITMALTGGKFDGQSWILLIVMLQLLIGSHVVVLQLILNALAQSHLLLRASSYALLGFVCFALIASQLADLGILFAPLVFSLVLNLLIVSGLNRSGYPYRPAWKMLRGMAVLGGGIGASAAVLLAMIQPAARAIVVAGTSGFSILMAFVLGIYAFSLIDDEDINLIRSLLSKKKGVQSI